MGTIECARTDPDLGDSCIGGCDSARTRRVKESGGGAYDSSLN